MFQPHDDEGAGQADERAGNVQWIETDGAGVMTQ